MKDTDGRDNREDFHVHGGSIKLETLQASPEWSMRVVCPEDAPKRKYAICFGYTGTNYQGLQINPDAITVEAVLEKCLFLAGGIIEKNFGNIQKINWSRTARTDKGVHALAQCCSMKLCFPLGGENEFRDRVNSLLPPDIRIHYIQKVGKSFNAKLHCSHRRYQYLFPTYLLQSREVILKLLSDAFIAQGPIPNAAREGGYAAPGESTYLSPDSLARVRDSSLTSFRCPREVLEKFQEGLKIFEGTRNYHNFTSNKDPNEASAKRFITSSTCSDPFVDITHGVEWICISISGQSFLLNQIRKMVNLALEYGRGAVSLDRFNESFSAASRIDIPMVPGMGCTYISSNSRLFFIPLKLYLSLVYLDELSFDLYNNKLETLAVQHERSLVNKAQRQQEKEAALAAVEGDCEAGTQQNFKKQKIDTLANDGKDGEREGDDDKVLHSPLIWSSLPELKERLQSFKSEAIWGHIFAEEKNSLSFLYYLDFMRVYSPTYDIYPSKSCQRSFGDAKNGKLVDNSGD